MDVADYQADMLRRFRSRGYPVPGYVSFTPFSA